MRLSENFSHWEFACRCGRCTGWVVSPILVRALEDLRSVVGEYVGRETPIHILSGIRCPSHNASVGGVRHSRHLPIWEDGLGTTEREVDAADVTIGNLSARKIFNLARLVPAFDLGGLGVYDARGFCHLDTRGRKARWAQLVAKGPMVGIPRNWYERIES